MTRDEYVQEICSRRSATVCVPYKVVSLEGWEPQPSRCHENVDTWVRAHSDLQAVRGWVIYADFGLSCGLTAHSVVQGCDGDLYDITPIPGAPRPPFIRHLGNDATFFSSKDEGHTFECPCEKVA